MYRVEREISYENRAVAFVDILGWRTAVEVSLHAPEMRNRLHNAVWALGAMSLKDTEDDCPAYPSRDQVTQFSDSVVVSVPFAEPNDIGRLVRQIAG